MSRLRAYLLFPATSSSYVYMIIVLNGVSGDMLATIELEDARGATVADLLEAVRGAYHGVLSDMICKSWDPVLCEVGTSWELMMMRMMMMI